MLRHRHSTPKTSEAHQVCNQCSLASLCLPLGLSENEALMLEESMAKKRVILHAGDSLFLQGEKLKGLFAVRSGSFKTLIQDSKTQTKATGFYLPGEILGFDAMEKEQFVSSAIALETSSACFFPIGKLLDLAVKIPKLQKQLFKFMARDMNKGLALSLNTTAEGRIAAFLLNISSRLKERGYSFTEFSLSMSRQDIAAYLALTPETVSRLITKLQKNGLISCYKRKIRLLKPEQLQTLINGPGSVTWNMPIC